MLKIFAVAAALLLTPAVASAAMDCCKDCKCCDDKAAPKAAEKPAPQPPPDHKH